MTAAAEGQAGERRLRVAVVNSHPIQYFAPLYRYLTEHGVDLTALYLSDFSIRGATDAGFGQVVKWDIDLLEGYKHKFIGPNYKSVIAQGFWSLATPALWREIARGDYDVVVVHGYAFFDNVMAALMAKLSGKALILRGETHLGLRRVGFKAAVRQAFVRFYYRRADALFSIGRANAAFYRSLGVKDERIFTVPYTVDNDRFTRQSQLDAAERTALRAELGVDDDTPIVLYCSKTQRRKHPDAVVRAVQQLEREGANVALVIAGSGEMDAELKAMVAAGGPRRAAFTGFVNQSRLPKVLGACDVFTLPSDEEPWGLIVNEAMCAGLPVIAGDKVGSVYDLIAVGENGFTVPAGDAGAIAEALRPIVADAGLRQRMSARSREIIAGWSYAQCLAGWQAALASLSRRKA